MSKINHEQENRCGRWRRSLRFNSNFGRLAPRRPFGRVSKYTGGIEHGHGQGRLTPSVRTNTRPITLPPVPWGSSEEDE